MYVRDTNELIETIVCHFVPGEELWIAGAGPRPQEWPGGYPGDLGELLAQGRSC